MTPTPIKDTAAMIAQMSPELVAGLFVFRTFDGEPPAHVLAQARAMFREPEGVSLVLPVEAVSSGEPAMRQISLRVFSSLEGVGLTAAVATALTEAGIACNMVAAYRHDHVFVPSEQADLAVSVLKQASARAKEAAS